MLAELDETRRMAQDWAGRILVGGSDAGWLLWEGDPPRNTAAHLAARPDPRRAGRPVRGPAW